MTAHGHNAGTQWHPLCWMWHPCQARRAQPLGLAMRLRIWLMSSFQSSLENRIPDSSRNSSESVGRHSRLCPGRSGLSCSATPRAAGAPITRRSVGNRVGCPLPGRGNAPRTPWDPLNRKWQTIWMLGRHVHQGGGGKPCKD